MRSAELGLAEIPPPFQLRTPNWPVEARGIEPRSENRSETASTCVCLACGLRQQEPDRPCCQTIFLNLTQRAEATRYASPNLRYSGAASGELPPEQVREAEAYAAIARLELAVKNSQ